MSYELKPRMEGDGFWMMGTAGEDLGARKLVYLTSDSEWKLADADIAASMPVIGMTQHAISYGRRGQIFFKGFIGDVDWAWTVGGTIYPSATAGELTQTLPSTATIQQIAGYAYNSTLIYFSPRQSRGGNEVYYQKLVNMPVESLGRPNTNPPDVIDQANLRLLKFAVNTDSVSIKMVKPYDWVTGALELGVVWTNDGGVDDLNKNVRVQMDYQTGSEGDVIDGSHTNSPKNVNDAYVSNAGWVECHTDFMTMAQADFENEQCIYCKFSFVTAPDTILSCEPHMIGICVRYNASPDR